MIDSTESRNSQCRIWTGRGWLVPHSRAARLIQALSGLALIAIVLWGLSACGSSEPEGPTPEQKAGADKQRAEEAAAAQAAAAAALAAPEPVAPPAPPPPPAITEESIPEFKYLEGAEAGQAGPSDQLALAAPGQRGLAQPGQVRVAVLYGPGQERSAVGVATVIDTWRKDQLAKSVGMPVKVAFLSRHDQSAGRENRIRYRPGALKAALQVAEVLPGEQSLEPMSAEEETRSAVDLVIYLGTAVP
jgi:hypothetical protein